jgi:hypothetical protein
VPAGVIFYPARFQVALVGNRLSTQGLTLNPAQLNSIVIQRDQSVVSFINQQCSLRGKGIPYMPAKDVFHEAVKKALLNEGWTITADPLYIQFGGVDLYVDLAAEKVIAAEKDGRKIAVEIKSPVHQLSHCSASRRAGAGIVSGRPGGYVPGIFHFAFCPSGRGPATTQAHRL